MLQAEDAPTRVLTPPSKSGGGASRPTIVLERQQAIERAEHIATVTRTRRTMLLGLLIWYAFAIIDYLIARWIVPGTLWWNIGLRFGGGVPIVLFVAWVHRDPPPSPTALRRFDDTVYTWASLVISIMCVRFRGIASPYANGVSLVLVVRNFATADHWRIGWWRLALPAVMFPLVMIFFGGGWHDPAEVTLFVINMMFIGGTWLLTVAGGHLVWTLRRQVFEARSLGHYRLRRCIGAGGMGEVWEAHDGVLKKEVAVKILRPDLEPAEREVAVARFRREVKAMSELHHPNTVQVLDYGVTDDGIWYYAMELLAGETLQELVKRDGPLAPERAAALMSQAAAALGHAHEHGIVHRDVKPSNLFILDGDRVKVLDFGIASVASIEKSGVGLTSAGVVLGTPLFISPEAAAGKPVGAPGDVYGLGAVLYYALTGAPPFRGSTPNELYAAHMSAPAQAPSVRAGHEMPGQLDEIVLRCLAKEPADRFPSASELSKALKG
jgi:serine/threonine-protein kinase